MNILKTFVLGSAFFAAAITGACAEGGGVSGAVVKDPVVLKECSACHMAYPAQFLPQRSWVALMADLGNHFGEDATLPPETATAIQAYLVANAADGTAGKVNKRLMRGINDADTPLRFTELTWWKRAHDEVNPARFTSAKIKSASNCMACHAAADKGVYEDD